MNQSYLTWCVVIWLSCLGGTSLLAQAPINDSVCNAIALSTYNQLLVFDNRRATAQLGESVLPPPINGEASNFNWRERPITHSVWFTIEAPASGSLQIDLCNDSTSFDTQIALYEVGDCSNFGSFVLKGANDDLPNRCQTNSGVASIWASTLEVKCLIPGETYYLLVDGWTTSDPPDSVGTFGIILTEIPTSSDPFSALLKGVNPTCPGELTGQVAVANVIGGQEPYRISWDIGSENPVVRNLPEGTYQVTLRDACDSVYVDSISLETSIAPLAISFQDTVAACQGTDIQLGEFFEVSGGVPVETNRLFAVDLGTNDIFSSQVSGADQFASVGDIPDSVLLPTSGDLIDNYFYFLSSSINQDSRLYRYRLDTRQMEEMGAPGIRQFQDEYWGGSTFDEKTGNYYALLFNDSTFSGSLYTLDTATGAATFVTDLSETFQLPAAMAADTSGRLYVIDVSTNTLIALDKQNGDGNIIGELSFSPKVATVGLDFDPSTNRLYMIATDVEDAFRIPRLYEIDITDGYSFTNSGYGSVALVGALGIRPRPQNYTYSWVPPLFLDDPFGEDPTLTVLIDTAYQSLVTDFCRNQVLLGPINIKNNFAPTLEFNASPATSGGVGQATVVATGDGPFTYLWEGGETTETIALPGGITSVTVTDANGCVRVDSVFIGTVGIDQRDLAGIGAFSLYPNPTTQQVNLDLTLLNRSALQWRLMDIQGNVLATQSYPAVLHLQTSLQVEQFAAGVYLFEVQTTQGVLRERLMIK